jgi:hypothetical protein
MEHLRQNQMHPIGKGIAQEVTLYRDESGRIMSENEKSGDRKNPVTAFLFEDPLISAFLQIYS